MVDNLSQLDAAALFHSVLFAYQKALGDVLTTNTAQIVLPRMMPYLDRIRAHTEFKSIENEDPERTLRQFGDLLVRSKLAANVEVEKTKKGFVFAVKGCVFAGHIHKMLDPRDVTCPYGIIAYYLAERSGMRVQKGLTTFTPWDSFTAIEQTMESEVAEDLRSWAGMRPRGPSPVTGEGLPAADNSASSAQRSPATP